MKARVKATGEIVEFELSHYIGNVAWYITKCNASYSENELEFIDAPEDYWTRLEHQYAGMAMQGLVTRGEVLGSSVQEIARDIAEISCEVAHALVEKMKSNN